MARSEYQSHEPVLASWNPEILTAVSGELQVSRPRELRQCNRAQGRLEQNRPVPVCHTLPDRRHLPTWFGIMGGLHRLRNRSQAA